MADQANVLIKSDNREGVYLYAQARGYDLPVTVQNALKREERWGDEEYLNRIIFCEMVKDEIDSATGFGITGYVVAGAGRIIHIDVDRQEITLNDNCYSFGEYIQLNSKDIRFQ